VYIILCNQIYVLLAYTGHFVLNFSTMAQLGRKVLEMPTIKQLKYPNLGVNNWFPLVVTTQIISDPSG
jgi:hypothetical protein